MRAQRQEDKGVDHPLVFEQCRKPNYTSKPSCGNEGCSHHMLCMATNYEENTVQSCLLKKVALPFVTNQDYRLHLHSISVHKCLGIPADIYKLICTTIKMAF